MTITEFMGMHLLLSKGDDGEEYYSCALGRTGNYCTVIRLEPPKVVNCIIKDDTMLVDPLPTYFSYKGVMETTCLPTFHFEGTKAEAESHVRMELSRRSQLAQHLYSVSDHIRFTSGKS